MLISPQSMNTKLPPPAPPSSGSKGLGADPSFDILEQWTRANRILEDHDTAENAAEAYHHKSRQNGIKAFLQ